MKFFQNTKHRVAELANELANTTRLAVDTNFAVDRVEGDLKKATDWISTADGVIINLSENVQKLSNLAAARIADLNDRVNRLSDDLSAVTTVLSERLEKLENVVVERPVVVEQPQRVGPVGDRAATYAHEQRAAGQPVLVKDALGGRKLGGRDRDAVRRAFVQMGLTRMEGRDPELWVMPVRTVVDKPRDQMTRDERWATRRDRKRIRRAAA